MGTEERVRRPATGAFPRGRTIVRQAFTCLAFVAGVGTVATVATVATLAPQARADGEDDRHPLVVEVVGSDGRPAADAPVALLPGFAARNAWIRVDDCIRELPAPEVPVASGRTGSDGRVRFDGLATAMYRVVAQSPGGVRVVERQPVARGVPAAPLRVVSPAGLTLRGVARRADGRPVAGLTVVVEPEDTPWFRIDPAHRVSTVTGADGAWTIKGLAPDSYDVWTCRAAGALDLIATVDLSTSRSIDTPAPDGGVFRATVVAAEDGAPLPGAEVEVWDLARSDGSFRLGRATTDAAGICSVATGRAHATVSFVSIRCAGRRPWVASALGLAVPDGATVGREFRIPRAEPFEGRVVGPGGGISGARVAQDLPNLRPWERVLNGAVSVTDANGNFRLDHVTGPVASVRVTADGYTEKSAAPRRDGTGSSAPVVRLEFVSEQDREVPRHLVCGTVRLPGGAPAPGAFVWSEFGSTVTAADGSFALETVSQYSPRCAFFPGHEALPPDSGWCVVGSGDPLTIELIRSPVIRGTVKSATGANVAGARVFVVEGVNGRQSARAPHWSSAAEARVAADGSFEVELPVWFGGPASSGEYVVAVQFPGHAPAISTPVRVPLPDWTGHAATKSAEPPAVHLVLDAGATLSGRVVTAVGKPVRGAAITLLPGRAQDLHSLPWPPQCLPLSRALRTTTDADGAFSIPHLRPGRYTVTATPVAGTPLSKSVSLPSDTAPLELRLGE